MASPFPDNYWLPFKTKELHWEDLNQKMSKIQTEKDITYDKLFKDSVTGFGFTYGDFENNTPIVTGFVGRNVTYTLLIHNNSHVMVAGSVIIEETQHLEIEYGGICEIAEFKTNFYDLPLPERINDKIIAK
jgi:hypothetical protein